MASLGELAVFLKADSSGVDAGIASAKASLASFATNATVLIAGIATAWHTAKESINAYAEKEAVQARLTKVLKNAGDDVDKYKSKLIEEAEQLAKTTIYCEDMITKEMSLARVRGIGVESIGEMTRAAAGLAGKYGLEFPQAMEVLARASHGYTERLKRQGIFIDETKSKQEQFNELLKMGTDYLNTAGVAGGTLSNKQKMLAKATEDVWKAFGYGAEKIFDMKGKLDAYTKTLQNIAEKTTKFFEDMEPSTAAFVGNMATMAGGLLLLKPGISVLSTIVGYGKTTFMAIASGIATFSGGLTTAAVALKTFTARQIEAIATTYALSGSISTTMATIATSTLAAAAPMATFIGLWVALPAAVAAAGVAIGMFIHDLTPVGKMLDDLIAKMDLFGAKRMEKDIAKTEAETKALDDMHKKRASDPEFAKKLKEDEEKRKAAQNPLFEDEVKALEEYQRKTQEINYERLTAQGKINALYQEMADIDTKLMNNPNNIDKYKLQKDYAETEEKIRKIEEESLEKQKDLQNAIKDAQFEKLTPELKIMELKKEQLALIQQINRAEGIDKIQMQKTLLESYKKTDDLKKEQADKLQSSQKSLAETVESSLMSQLDKQKQIQMLEAKRVQLRNAYNKETDLAKRNELAKSIIEVGNDIAGRQKNNFKPETRTIGAMERGSVEAYSTAVKAGMQAQDKIAENTKKSVSVLEDIKVAVKSLKGQGMAIYAIK